MKKEDNQKDGHKSEEKECFDVILCTLRAERHANVHLHRPNEKADAEEHEQICRIRNPLRAVQSEVHQIARYESPEAYPFDGHRPRQETRFAGACSGMLETLGMGTRPALGAVPIGLEADEDKHEQQQHCDRSDVDNPRRHILVECACGLRVGVAIVQRPPADRAGETTGECDAVCNNLHQRAHKPEWYNDNHASAEAGARGNGASGNGGPAAPTPCP